MGINNPGLDRKAYPQGLKPLSLDWLMRHKAKAGYLEASAKTKANTGSAPLFTTHSQVRRLAQITSFVRSVDGDLTAKTAGPDSAPAIIDTRSF